MRKFCTEGQRLTVAQSGEWVRLKSAIRRAERGSTKDKAALSSLKARWKESRDNLNLHVAECETCIDTTTPV